MKTFVLSLVVALPLLFASSVLAQHRTFTISPESSDVSFTLGGSGHETHGTFHVQNGSIHSTSPIRNYPVVVVAAGSGKTGNDSHDKKMRTKCWMRLTSPMCLLFRKATRARSLPPATRRYRSLASSRARHST